MSDAPVITKPEIDIERNAMQMLVRYAQQPVVVVEAGRGAGKSTVLADVMVDVVHDMVRSTNFLQGETYQQILTRTLPSTIESLTTLGYVKDHHYFIGRRPPKNWGWKEAYQPPQDYTKAISWYNGTCYLLFSQDVSSRGPNTASGIGDEVALLDPTRLQSEALATLRQAPKRFGNCRRYLSQTFVTSIPRTQRGKFIYKFEEDAMATPEKVAFIRASSMINKANLPAQWFADQRRMLSKYDYDIEILNIRPRAMKGGFYPLFSEASHTYTAYNNDFLSGLVDDGYSIDKFKKLDCRQDLDHNPDRDLSIALDYGKFNCMVTGQLTLANMFRYLSGFSVDVEQKKTTKELIEDWCTYYRFNTNRHVHYYYDATAKGRSGLSVKAYYEIVIDTLRNNGWTVIPHDYGKPPDHVDKYNFWDIAFRNDHPNLPKFSLNKNNCQYVIASIEGADAREGRNGIEKIKTPETKDALDQRYTTHFSDAFDMLGYYKFGHLIKDTGIWLPPAFLTMNR